MVKGMRFVLFLSVVCWSSSSCYGQKYIPQDIKRIQMSNFKNGECLKFIDKDDLPHDDIDHLQQVVIIRHGEPALKKKGWKNRKEAVRYKEMYDSVGVYDFDKKPICLRENEVAVVYTSKLRRAINTAEKTISDNIQIDSFGMFNEYQRKVICFPNIKMPRRFWSITGGILWMLGFNHKGIETFSEAKNRSRRAAFFLDEKATNNKKAVLFSHGFLNRYINRYMKKLGYKSINLHGSKYLGAYYFYKIKKQ